MLTEFLNLMPPSDLLDRLDKEAVRRQQLLLVALDDPVVAHLQVVRGPDYAIILVGVSVVKIELEIRLACWSSIGFIYNILYLGKLVFSGIEGTCTSGSGVP